MRVQETQINTYRNHMEMIEDTIEEMKKKGVGVAKAMSSHKSAQSVLSVSDSQVSNVSRAGGSSSDNTNKQ